MAKYVEIHLRIEEQTLRDMKHTCLLKRMGGSNDMCSEAWVKVIEAMDNQKNIADVILKEHKEEEEGMYCTPYDPETDTEPTETRTEYCNRMGFDM